MANLTEKIDEISSLIERMNLSRRKVDKAMKRALNKTIHAFSTFSAKEISSAASIKRDLIKNRMKLIRATRDNRAAISMLTYSVPAVILGAPVQTESGVDVGSHFFKGAFVAHASRMKGRSRDFVFKRTGRDRYPLREMRVPIYDDAVRVFSQQLADVEERLLKNFLHEIKWASGLIKRGA